MPRRPESPRRPRGNRFFLAETVVESIADRRRRVEKVLRATSPEEARKKAEDKRFVADVLGVQEVEPNEKATPMDKRGGTRQPSAHGKTIWSVEAVIKTSKGIERREEKLISATTPKEAERTVKAMRGVIRVEAIRAPDAGPGAGSLATGRQVSPTLPDAPITPDAPRRREKAPDAARRAAVGRNTTALSIADPRNSYTFKFRVIDLGSLITSHLDNLETNPDVPQELQPRLRDRAGSRSQIDKLAKTLEPKALLTDTQQIDSGTPIIGPDSIVESGNGRVMALRRAVDQYPKRAADYLAQLRLSLENFGFNAKDTEGMAFPVLVRERVTKLDRAKFAAEANTSAVLTMSPLEQAIQDAGRLSGEVIGNIRVRESQSLDQALLSPDNRDVINQFIGTIPDAERGGLQDAKGQLNVIGINRLKAALFTRTYPGEAGVRLTTAFFESLDPTLKNAEAAMMQSLPAMSRAEALALSGARDINLSIAEDMSASIDMLARLKQQGMKVEDFLGQTTLFQRELTPFQERLLKHLDSLTRSGKKMREFLEGYAQAVVAAPPPQQGALFGGEKETKEIIVERIIKGQEGGGSPNAPKLL